MVVAILGGVIAGIALLTATSSDARGPVSSFLIRSGSAFAAIEHAVRQKLIGSSRADGLAWFAPLRERADSLRSPGRVLFGAYDGGIPATLDGVVDLEKSLGTVFPLVHFYTAWGDGPQHRFPLQITTAIWNLGSVPVITWEPWLSAFDNSAHPGIPLRADRELHGLSDVARGVYDFYVDEWAKDAARFGHPIFVRLAHEMNDPYRYPWGPQNNTKEEYIAAWRHVVDRFRSAGATNAIWVWSPHVAYEYWPLYYPGDEYTDWVGTGALNYGPIAYWSQWWTFDQIFGRNYGEMAKFGKPVMIAELGSLAVGGNRSEWYRAALAEIATKEPAVKAILFFNKRDDQSVTAQKIDWTLSGDSAVVKIVAAAVRSMR